MSVASMPVAVFKRVFDWKVRGIRWIEIIGVMLVAAMVFSVYLAKAAAAREGAQIDSLERQIAENGQRVRLLRAEVARLEQPGRLEALSRGAGLGPVDVKRQATEASLPSLAPVPEPRVIVAPTVPQSVPATPAPAAGEAVSEPPAEAAQ
ncbi:cell division protein FtsL [Brevundimonas sp. Root1279]|uniref:cell division protein FtsL n=1 Tax=Brevundimonas sp. Root1279 TaxID=1736443 RepID=UPI000A6552DF|nr:cell division protein [Brevundimonas sp. Root1279]